MYQPPSDNHLHFYEIPKIIDELITSLPTSPSIILTRDFNYTPIYEGGTEWQ